MSADDARLLTAALLVIMTSSSPGQGAFQAPVHDGQYAARLTNTSPTTQWVGDTSLDRGIHHVPVRPGQQLRLSFWLRSANPIPAVVHKVTVAAHTDALGKQHRGDTDFLTRHAIGPAWTHHTFDYVVPPNAHFIGVGFRAAAGGNPPHSILIDDVSLTDPQEGSRELLTNGGFETWPGDGVSSFPKDWRFAAVGGSRGSLVRVDRKGLGMERALAWHTDLDRALEAARAARRPLLIFFTAPGLLLPQHYETKVFPAPEIQALLREHYVLVRIDIQRQPDLARSLHVFQAGTLVVYNPDGRPLDQISEPLTPQQLQQRLLR